MTQVEKLDKSLVGSKKHVLQLLVHSEMRGMKQMEDVLVCTSRERYQQNRSWSKLEESGRVGPNQKK